MIDINHQPEEISLNTPPQQEFYPKTSKKKYIIAFMLFVLILIIGITIGTHVLESKNKQLETQSSTLKSASFQTITQNLTPTIFVTPVIRDNILSLPTGKIELPVDCYPSSIYENLLACLNVKDKQIYIEDLTTKQFNRITNSDGAKSNIYIYGDYVIWTDDREKKVVFTDTRKHDWISKDVYVYNLKTNKEKKLSTVPAYRYKLQLYDHYAAWSEQKIDDLSDISLYIYDIARDKEVFSSTVKSHKTDINLNDNKLVWLDDRDVPHEPYKVRKYRVYLYDILTGKEQEAVQYPSSKSNPYIEGNILVWIDNRNDRPGDVYMKDINSPDEILVSSSVYEKQNLGIYQKIIWWNISQSCDVEILRSDGSKVEGHTGIYTFNTETRKEEKIYDGKSMLVLSYKNRLFLRDNCGKENVFTALYL